MTDALLSESALSQGKSPNANYSGAVISRYSDAYLHANTINGFGKFIKVASIALGGLVAVIGFFSCVGSASSNSFGAGVGILGGGMTFIIGIVIGFVGFAIGVVVQSGAQQLKANLDCAVSSSPFLNDDQRAAAMSLL